MQRDRGKLQNGKDQRSLQERERDLRKVGEIKGTFHGRMGMMKDRNGKNLTEAHLIKKRWQGYTKELYKKKKRSSGTI